MIGAQRALDLSIDSETHELAAEAWNAQLFALSDPEDDHGPLDRQLIARAAILRVNRWDDDWLDSLDAVSGDLQQVGEAFLDEDVIMGVDEDSVFASSLVILDFVGVPEQHRGSGNSLALARGAAHIFRKDIVALMPAELSRDETGKLVLDLAKRDAVRADWIKSGFVEIPGTSVLMLPFSAKDGGGSSE
ncbi:hypothetical protein [Microbacterium sp. PM5]|uniref:hypothetical protein n=1 Tax=Microbacterium sp. PM5 TaxID=2014534 RepID=UPI000DD120AC|nr:hypothetical protein [Microbacterium sp. PM5]AXA96851.1 hypothetical protein CEP17_10790 [Microbacterium sp. PM5]